MIFWFFCWGLVMRRYGLILGSIFVGIVALVEADRTLDFNRDWEFVLDVNAEALEPSEVGGAWAPVRLPHDWVIEGSAVSNHPFMMATGVIPSAGIGWYRKPFEVAAGASKKVQVLFDGVYNNSEVWINGYRLGFHPYGYSPFYYDLTPYLNADGENEIVVKVDHTRYADSRWYTGAGIYRDVQLITTDRLHIPIWGTFFSTPEVSAKEAIVRAQIEVRNEYPTDRVIELRTVLINPTGEQVATHVTHATITAFARKSIRQELTVPHPMRWGVDAPHLYQGVTEIWSDGERVDQVNTRFGIRSFRFDPDEGFFLNGENLKIKGVCLHHDGGLVGTAVPDGVWRRRLEILREGGCNAIRSAHNPASDAFLDLCDEMGFLVQDEFFDEWDYPKDKQYNQNEREVLYETQGYAEHFQEWAERDLKATVLSHRNHPSIIQWSIGNEIEWTYPRNQDATGFFNNMNWKGGYFWSKPPFTTDEIKHQLATLPRQEYDIGRTATQLANWVRDVDLTRPVTANCILPSASHFSGYADALDVMGYSYRRVLYEYGHEILPDTPIMGTENVPQYHEWKAVMEHDHISGTFLWTGVDYMGELREPYPVRFLDCGMLDGAGFKKPQWHMYRTLWSEKPHIALATNPIDEIRYKKKVLYTVDKKGNVVRRNRDGWQRMVWGWQTVVEHWNHEPNETMVVEAYTNCDEIELFLNERSLGRKKRADFEDNIVKWAVTYQPGRLVARGWKDGKPVTEDALITHGKPAGVRLEVDHSILKADGEDVAHLVAQLVDAQGHPVLSEERELVFEVPRGLRLLGVDNGNHYSVQDYKSDRIITDQGRALLIVQTTEDSVVGKVRVNSRGLKGSTVEVVTKEKVNEG